MHPQFLQEGFRNQLSHVIEECGEFLAAAGKLQRWGAFSTNPLLPKEEREYNIDWLIRELNDLRITIERLEKTIEKELRAKEAP